MNEGMNRTVSRHGPASVALVVIVAIAGCAGPPRVERQRALTFEREATQFITMKMSYLLYLPPGYEDPAAADRRWPLVVMLHGIGENGRDLNKVLKYGPAKQVEAGRDYPFLVMTPQNPDGLWDMELLIAAIDRVMRDYRVDPRRVYGTGVSLGGLGTYTLATTAPNLFAAILPVSGWGYPAEMHRIAHLPIRAHHGAADWIVDPDAHAAVIEAHQAAGGSSELIIHAGVGHDVWSEVYPRDDWHQWLLRHRHDSESYEQIEAAR